MEGRVDPDNLRHAIAAAFDSSVMAVVTCSIGL